MNKKIVIGLSISVTLISSCGNSVSEKTWVHYALNLPGSISQVAYGTREYWEKNGSYQFTAPDEKAIDKTMTAEIARTFEDEDPRKILNYSNVSISYGIKNNLYGYDTNTDLRGYKLFDQTLEKEGQKVLKLLVKNDYTPAAYTNVLFATAVITNQDNFNEYCWANDHDVLGYYTLGNDISYIQTVSSTASQEQTNFSFLGTLDGRYHTINKMNVSNNVLGIFGCSLHSKVVEGISYSPSIKNLTINNVEGENRIFGESLNNLTANQLTVSQGDGKISSDGLLAKNLGNQNAFHKCTFTFTDSLKNPCLFVNETGSNNTFASTTIKYMLSSTRVIQSDDTTGPGGTISGISWKTLGDINLSSIAGEAINVIGSEPLEYLNINDDPSTKNNEIAEYLYPRQGHSNFVISGVEIKYFVSKSVTYPLYIQVADSKEMTNIVKTIEITNQSSNKAILYNLFPNKTYFYRIIDSSDTTKSSIVDSFSYASPVRAIYNAGSIKNMRDIGGWMTQSGKPINYGLVYRSATWENLDSDGAGILSNELGIKNEIDLRFDHSTRQHTYTQFNFIHNGLIDAYPLMFTDSNTIANIKNLFNILSDEKNYPLTYHCSAGADRTGLASLLIEGCLGVSDEDIYRDYELTTFYQGNRTRADIKVDDKGNYYFREDGGRSDFWKESGFKQLLETNLKSYYTESGKVCDAIVNFLKTKCLISDTTINKVRDILISK